MKNVNFFEPEIYLNVLFAPFLSEPVLGVLTFFYPIKLRSELSKKIEIPSTKRVRVENVNFFESKIFLNVFLTETENVLIVFVDVKFWDRGALLGIIHLLCFFYNMIIFLFICKLFCLHVFFTIYVSDTNVIQS